MSSGPAPVIASKTPDPPAIVADAKDLKVLRKAVEDASTVGVGLWVSYLFVLFYLLVAAGSVTHKDLFFETAVKLPFLGVDLPLKGFFVLGPLLFLIVHAYVLLHFAMLSGKVRAFDAELCRQINDIDVPGARQVRTDLRRQLPSNIFVQFLAGPNEVRDGTMGFFLWLIALVSLVLGPVCLLMFFELQFLPYHNEWISWWHRIAVGADLVLMWLFWPTIVLLDGGADDYVSATQRIIRLQRRLTWGLMWGIGGAAALLMVMFATYPGERMDSVWWGRGLFSVPEPLPTVRRFLVGGWVNPASRKPESLWSNRLVLPGLDVVVHLKLDSEDKIKFLPETVSLRDRDLVDAVLIGAVLRKADFTGARLQGALLSEADLREAKMGCTYWLEEGKANGGTPDAPICTQLQGASLDFAQLQGASLDGAQLQGASLFLAQLQGASLNDAKLQGASLDGVQLQGASLSDAQLQGASLKSTFVWRADAISAATRNTWIEPVSPYASASCDSPATNNICDWTPKTFEDLIALITKTVPEGRSRDAALKRINSRLGPVLDRRLDNEDAMRMWWGKPHTQPSRSDHEAEFAHHWQIAGCSAAGAPHVVSRMAERLDPSVSEIDRLVYDVISPFSDNSPEPAKLAAAFLDQRCDGARGLSDFHKAILLKLRGPVAATPTPSPGR